MKSSVKEKEKLLESEIRKLAEILTARSVVVRREQLSRGRSYRVKSGDCVLSGANTVFVDKRLPLEQQVSVLVDFLVDLKLDLQPEELSELPGATQDLLRGRHPSATHAEAA